MRDTWLPNAHKQPFFRDSAQMAQFPRMLTDNRSDDRLWTASCTAAPIESRPTASSTSADNAEGGRITKKNAYPQDLVIFEPPASLKIHFLRTIARTRLQETAARPTRDQNKK